MKNLVFMLISLILIGCATQTPIKYDRSRVVFRDLQNMPAPDVPKASLQDLQSFEKAIESFPVKNIEFENESSHIKPLAKKNLISWLKSDVSNADMLIILGHSHGPSAIGTDKLAVARVRSVRGLIEKNSTIQNIFTLSSWGEDKKDFAPNKAVQIFQMRSFHKKQFSIVFSKGNQVQILNSLLKH